MSGLALCSDYNAVLTFSNTTGFGCIVVLNEHVKGASEESVLRCKIPSFMTLRRQIT